MTHLGKHRNTPPKPAAKRYRPVIAQSVAQRLAAMHFKKTGVNLPGGSLLWCGRGNAGMDRTVGRAEFEIGGANGARRVGAFQCGCAWTCECCARKTVAKNRSFIRGGVIGRLEERGLSASMVTLTLSHHYGEDWREVVNRLRAAFKAMDRRLNKAYKKAGYIGKIKAFEVTVGKNGLHPHFHLLIVHSLEADTEQLEAAMRAAWEQAVTEEGGRCTEHGFDFKAHCVNDYVAKMESAHEMASQNTKEGRKKGRTLSQLLNSAYRGDETAAHEWTRAIIALEGVNRFNVGQLAKKLDLPPPSEWEDEAEEDAQGELELAADPVVIEFPLQDIIEATHPCLGRAGMALILRALDRGGEASGRVMVAALVADYARKRKPWPPAWTTFVDLAIIDVARTRPLQPEEVPGYLRARQGVAV